MSRSFALLSLSCALLSTVAPRVRAQDSVPPPPATPSLLTAEQAERGSKVYQKVCAECHELLEYTGGDFRTKWNSRPVFDLFDLIRSTMPDGKPGTLPAQDYADIVAYMMKLNGVTPGKTELPAVADSLKLIKIVLPAPGGLRTR
jgi:mono/diheme cytochrome c family protein